VNPYRIFLVLFLSLNVLASQRTVKAPPEKEKNGKSTASKQEEDYRTSKETAMLIQQKVILNTETCECTSYEIPTSEHTPS